MRDIKAEDENAADDHESDHCNCHQSLKEKRCTASSFCQDFFDFHEGFFSIFMGNKMYDGIKITLRCRDA